MTDLVRSVAQTQREQLLDRSRKLSDDPRVVTGLSWGIAALDRVLKACDGVTDPVALGLEERAPETAGQDDLFAAGGAL